MNERLNKFAEAKEGARRFAGDLYDQIDRACQVFSDQQFRIDTGCVSDAEAGQYLDQLFTPFSDVTFLELRELFLAHPDREAWVNSGNVREWLLDLRGMAAANMPRLLSLAEMRKCQKGVNRALRLAVEGQEPMEKVKFLTGVWMGFEWCLNPGAPIIQQANDELGGIIAQADLDAQREMFRNILGRMGGRPGGDE